MKQSKIDSVLGLSVITVIVATLAVNLQLIWSPMFSVEFVIYFNLFVNMFFLLACIALSHRDHRALNGKRIYQSIKRYFVWRAINKQAKQANQTQYYDIK